MAAQQKRMLTAASSKLGKTDIVRTLGKDEAWALLPMETRLHLYSLLPDPEQGQPPHDPNVHPRHTGYWSYIQNELRRWQDDLVSGREVKRWRDEAMKVGRDRADGQFDDLKMELTDAKWPDVGDENVPPKTDAAGETAGDDDDHGGKTKAEPKEGNAGGLQETEQVEINEEEKKQEGQQQQVQEQEQPTAETSAKDDDNADGGYTKAEPKKDDAAGPQTTKKAELKEDELPELPDYEDDDPEVDVNGGGVVSSVPAVLKELNNEKGEQEEDDLPDYEDDDL